MSSLEFKDILGLSDNYTRSDIKSAYYTLSRHYHPDSSSFNFLSTEEKNKMFNVISEAYQSLMKDYNDYYMDCPMYSIIEYEDDISIPQNKNIKNLEDFNKKFVEINRAENEDNPWSIHYNIKRDLTDKLALVKPDAPVYNNYYTFGVNNCPDYSVSGYYTDLEHLDKSNNIIPENVEMPDTLITDIKYIDTIPEHSEELKKEQIEINKIKEKIELDRRHIQNQRDISRLKL